MTIDNPCIDKKTGRNSRFIKVTGCLDTIEWIYGLISNYKLQCAQSESDIYTAMNEYKSYGKFMLAYNQIGAWSVKEMAISAGMILVKGPDTVEHIYNTQEEFDKRFIYPGKKLSMDDMSYVKKDVSDINNISNKIREEIKNAKSSE